MLWLLCGYCFLAFFYSHLKNFITFSTFPYFKNNHILGKRKVLSLAEKWMSSQMKTFNFCSYWQNPLLFSCLREHLRNDSSFTRLTPFTCFRRVSILLRSKHFCLILLTDVSNLLFVCKLFFCWPYILSAFNISSQPQSSLSPEDSSHLMLHFNSPLCLDP